MKTDDSVSLSTGVPPGKKGDQTKLVSLLALATGAAVIPQTSRADIFFTDLSSSPVTVGFSGTSSYTFSLPGGAQFGFTASQSRKSTSARVKQIYYRTIFAGQQGGSISAGIHAKSNGFVATHAKGDIWSGQSAVTSAFVAKAKIYKILSSTVVSSTHQQAGYTHKYLAYEFNDGGTMLFGWVDVSLSNSSSTDPNVTIYGYAYDSSGNPIAIGEVPEPASMSILALGALMLGAKGLRTWRRNRAEARHS